MNSIKRYINIKRFLKNMFLILTGVSIVYVAAVFRWELRGNFWLENISWAVLFFTYVFFPRGDWK